MCNLTFSAMKSTLFIISWLFALCLSAQDPYATPINKRDGLPSSDVYFIHQDSKGFVWIASGMGLCRYDGFEFKTYHFGLHRSLTGSVIKEDRFGRIWYITFDGWMHYVEGDTLKALPRQQKPAGSVEYALTQNALIVPTTFGVDIFDLKTLNLSKRLNLGPFYYVSSIQWNNSLCLITDSLNIISESGTIKKYTIPANFPKAASMVAAPGGDLLLQERSHGAKKAYRFDGEKFIAAFNLTEGFIHSAQFCDNRFWFFTEDGIFTYTSNGNPLNGGKPMYRKEGMTCVMKDIENNIWLGSKDNAILLINDFSQHLLLKETPPTQIEVAGDTLFYGTRNGELFKLQLNAASEPVPLCEPLGESLYMLNYDTLYNYLVYTYPQGYLIRQNNQLLHYRNSALKAFTGLSKKYALVATSGLNGLIKLSEEPDPVWDPLWNRYQPNTAAKYSMCNITGNMRGRDVVAMEDKKHAWIATNQGLFSINPTGSREVTNNGTQIICREITAWQTSLFGLTINGDLILIRGDNQLEVLSGRFEIPGQLEQMYSFGNNLAVVNNKNIYIINMRNPNQGVTKIKTTANDVYDIDYYNGKLLIATSEGLLFLNYIANISKVFTPLFSINSILVNNVKTDEKDLLNLNSTQQQIEISYSVLAFGLARQEKLYYQLNDQPWIACDNNLRNLKLAALATGSYTLKFRFGSDNAKPISTLKFNILPPWWKRPFAIGLWILIVIIIIYLIYKSLLLAQEKKNKEITERLELERNFDRSVLTAIRSQMNPHFFFNALNTIQSYIFENDRQNAGNYLSKFSKLTRMVLEMSANDLITLAQEVDALQLYLELEKARFDGDFTFEMTFDENVDREMIRIPPMIFQPYVENAVKHGLLHKKGDKHLSLHFTCEQQQLITKIDDNGIGRKRSAELNRIRSEYHASFASEANQKRLELLNKGRNNKLGVEYIDKTNDNGQSAGTTVIISIPL